MDAIHCKIPRRASVCPTKARDYSIPLALSGNRLSCVLLTACTPHGCHSLQNTTTSQCVPDQSSRLLDPTGALRQSPILCPANSVHPTWMPFTAKHHDEPVCGRPKLEITRSHWRSQAIAYLVSC